MAANCYTNFNVNAKNIINIDSEYDPYYETKHSYIFIYTLADKILSANLKNINL